MNLPNQVIVTADLLNVRDAASPEGNIIGQLQKGTVFEAIEDTSGWYKLQFNGVEGYINNNYVLMYNPEFLNLQQEKIKDIFTSFVQMIQGGAV
jgi:uncharacterized protein YgiM (DUF1202 family)